MLTRNVQSRARTHAEGRARPLRKSISAATALLVLAATLIPATAAAAFEPAAVRNVKSANATDVGPGDTFNWMIEVGCSVLTDECVDAVLKDEIPAEFILPAPGDILLTPALNASERTITVSGQTVTVAFHQDLTTPAGKKGLTNGTVTVTIPVTVRSDLDYTPTPRTVVNTSEMVAENAPMRSSTASVQLTVPLELATQPTKSFSPATNIAVAGIGTKLTLGGANTSNAAVSSLTIQDPVNPAAAGNIFRTALKLKTLDSATWPAGATSAVVSLWDSSLTTPAWVDAPAVSVGGTLAFPASVDPANAGGVRIAFSSGTSAAIPRAASTSFVLDLENRAGITPATYSNTSQSVVARDTLSANKPVTATYVVTAATSSVSAGKSITPNRMSTVVFGSKDLTKGTVTLTGGNSGSISLASLTISEPSDPTLLDGTNPLAPAHTGGGLIFSGFTNGVVWPAGATAANITYYFADGTSSALPATSPGLPASGSMKRVTGFSVTFTGTMAQGVSATVPFSISSNPLQVSPNLSVLYTNQISVTAVDKYSQNVGPKYASDTVTVLAEQVNLETSKSLSRGSVRASSGQSTTATLTTHVLDYPNSTRALDHIEMTDPSAGTGLTDWYTYFNATRLVVTPVPGDATLTISYRDSAGTYTPLTVLGPGIQNYDIPSAIRGNIYGLKLDWDSTTGFQPDQTLVANVEYALRSTLRDTATPLPNAAAELENCSASSGTSGGGAAALSSNNAVSDPCPKVTLVPYDSSGSGGSANLLDKKFINTNNTNNQDVMNTRNGESTRARLSWSTDGYTGVNQMVVYDGAVDSSGNPDPAAWTKGMYDAYNLTQIPRISSIDALVKYDKVAIEFFSTSSSTWTTISGYCTLAAPCDGGTAATRTLTTAQQADFVAVRFTFTEGANRPGLAPAPGSGVADSIGNSRNIDLVFQMRDSLRSNAASPVVDGYRYNADVTTATPPAIAHSVVRNDAWSQATLTEGGPLTDRASDTLELRDPPLAVSANKTWTGGPIPIPDSSVTAQPSSRVTLTAINQTAAKVDSLTVSEPNTSVATPNDSPFEDWDLTRFQSVTHPSGATGLTVTIIRSTGGNLTASGSNLVTVTSTITGWSAAQLANTTAFTFAYTGQIKASNGTATIVFDLGLRADKRSGGAIVAGTDYNSTEATVADTRWDSASPVTNPTFQNATLSARKGANIALVASTIGVSTTKTFGKTSETEPDRSIFPLTLDATPSGSERVQSLTITDDRATFWNAFNFTGVAAGTPVLPVFSPTSSGSATVIQVEACISGTWTASNVAGTPSSGCVERGGSWTGAGTWKTAAQAQANFLPSGVTANQVEGLRITVKRLDDSQWENPQAPKVSIPILVQRRVDLRTGDPVRTDLPVNSASPGEASPGVTTNSLRAEVLGIWGKTATANNSATYVFTHATTGVQVQKRPTGVKAPGRVFDYTLSVTNTGNWPILNPVITDYLPSDSTGAQLIFDPDKPWTYKYALTGSAPASPNGTALPSGTSGPTADATSDAYGPTQIKFTFPVGSVLEVGQNYVITVPMMFRPGLINDTLVTNRFGIRGDRAFDTCTAPAGFSASYDVPSGECSTSTTVRPSEQAALRALMTVKANLDTDFPNDQGFIGGTNADCTAAKSSAGFSRLPCIPVTLPGQSETWRLTAQNTGTTNMPRLVLSTRLPDVSDKTILDGFLRESRWTAGFADEITANIGIPGAVITTYYTTAASPCKAVLQTPSNASACGSDPATGWAVWIAGALADPTVVTGLQFVIDFPSASLFKPADVVTIDIVTRTAALSATPGANTTAKNSLSASAITRTGATDTPVTALDYSVVAVALATGGLRLEKDVTGPAASFIPNGQTFTGKLVCTSLTETIERDYTMTIDTTTVPATVPVVTFNDLPGGAECTVTETGASGQSSYTATTVTIDPRITDPARYPMVTLTNDYQLAGLTVSKTVTTTATVIPTGFAFTVSCTFLGVAVPLAAEDASFTLDDTESRSITGIPVNSRCVVTETDAKGADTTIMTASTDSTHSGSSVAVDNTARTTTFTRLSPNNTDDDITNTTTADNRFDAPAALVVTKKLLGDGSAQFGEDKTFSVAVLCTFGATTQYDDSVLLNAGNAWQVVLENIIADSDCTFTESSLQGADAVVITPNDGRDTTVGKLTVPAPTVAVPSPVVNIDVTNWYLTGSIEVTKTFAGDTGAIDKFARNPVPAIEFEFSLSCVRDGEQVVIPGGATRTVTAASPVADYSGLASGAECLLSETRNGGASITRVLDERSAEVVDGAFTIAVDNTVLSVDDQVQPDLSVENTYRFAEVAATKQVINAADAGSRATGPFELTLECTLDGRSITAAEAAAQAISNGDVVTWTELAEGANCTIVETKTGGATQTTTTMTTADRSTGPSIAGTSVTLLPLRWTGADAPNAITFTNSFRLAYTGSDSGLASRVLLPLGLILVGGLFLGFVAAKRRGRRETTSIH
ncbi:von Willebrand factor, type A [marine actinobacterium PHSC20C1]|nr:von Willebrand factor, type A [marine actinobacterium PHSC20C1]